MFSTRRMRKIKLKSLLFGLCEGFVTNVFALPIVARVQLIVQAALDLTFLQRTRHNSGKNNQPATLIVRAS
jgi:hypothetical protein